MSIVVFVVVTIGAAGIAFLGHGREGVATGVGIGGLAIAVIAALAIDPTQTLSIGGTTVAASEYVRLFLILGSLVGLALAVVGLAAGSSRDAPAVMLGMLGGSGLALSLPDPRIAVLAATAGGLGGVLLTLTPTGGRIGATVGIRALRPLVIAGAMAIAATAWIGRDLSQLAAQPVVFGLAYLAFALAVAIRLGAIPFHVWAARLTDAVPEAALPIVTAWGPAAFAVVALAWTDNSVAPLARRDGQRAGHHPRDRRRLHHPVRVRGLDPGRPGARRRLFDHRRRGRGPAGRSPPSRRPRGRRPGCWILAYVVARSAFAAWAASLRATIGTGRIPELRGWALRAPVLGITFGVIVVAGIGLPGLAAFEARWDLVDLALVPPFDALVFLATLAPLAYYGRLLFVGLSRPERVDPEERFAGLPRRTPLDLNDVRGSVGTFWAANRAASSIAVASLTASWLSPCRPAALAGRMPRRPCNLVSRDRRSRSCRSRAHVRHVVARSRPSHPARSRARPSFQPIPPRNRRDPRRPSRPGRAPSGRRRARSRGAPRARTRAPSSVSAASGPSDAWTMFWAVSSAKSPRIVPGAASCGRVAPLIARTTAIAFGPSSAAATSGADVMKSTRPAKNGFSRWAA